MGKSELQFDLNCNLTSLWHSVWNWNVGEGIVFGLSPEWF